MIDVNVFLGAYPWRRVPGTSPEAVLGAMDRLGIEQAWATHLPSLFWKDPAAGNPWLAEVYTQDPYEGVICINTATAEKKNLKDGDTVEVSVSGIGAVRNSCWVEEAHMR